MPLYELQHFLKAMYLLYFQKREKEKAEKNAKFKALQQVCQESLDEDHRVAKEKRLAKKKEKPGKENEKSAHLGKITAAIAEDVQKQTIKNEDPGQTEEPVALVTSPPMGQPRASLSGLHEEVFETLEEEEECEDEQEMARLNQETLPWHHVQLYELYGKEADYFLHPKIETEAKADVVLNPRLKAVGGQAVKDLLSELEQGRADAGALWDALRYESRMKLINMDSKLLSSDLRSAFGAFAREGLTKNKKPVVRNFYSSDDVELMFRSSNINRDRTKVLLYNNPPPDLNNQEGTEGIDRYMPSWADTWDEESELSYKKWLSPRHTESQVEYGIQTSDRATPDNENPTSPPPSSQHHQKAKKSEQAKYVFLTEEQATTPGQFSRRRKETIEARGGPTAYSTQLPTIQMQKSHSAMAMLGNDGFDSSRSAGVSQPDKGERKRAQSDMSNHFITQWQPLSLNALLEYKQSHDALGQGEFGHGQKPVWSGVTSLTAV
ncbi:hypothetical protein LSH36_188g00010 [Paralvinella palmiformis]|uniref:Uncharacterized protein n=1 Tax=Paralvinella palmiformis TaxID=53620 RepID=A0AAD9JQW5_9ANNE|nr:hypothetical protein LSH36_188g00010 [Paralvinella palmiformis]